MPIYAFECDSCGHQFDRLQRLSDADPTVCPECGAEQVRRQLTAPSFRLAGAGWYETDFKKDGDKKRNLVDKADSPAASAPAKTESKVESKPEPKAATPAKPESKPAAKSSD
ncbi:MAG: transcriptional regulator [Gammaproteobacteria bacterium RIFCSPHIGHO2_12_FULL_63_22]|nr:MAG: transcriptional regulator [Gammaproteobacteria bacterium RIFCSPHIGHO2_12_FULL_63_22]